VSVTWQPALELLGQGASSTVSQAQIDAQINLAFKRSIPAREGYLDTKQEETERFKALIFELIALELLSRHPHVVDLIGITWETNRETEAVWPVLLTERSAYGSMMDFLQSDEGKTIDTKMKIKLCADVAKACLAMHRLGELSTSHPRHSLLHHIPTGIVHGDIKCENVLIFKGHGGLTAKLIDFGFSCFGTSESELVRVAHTKPWQAPEHGEQFFPFSSARRMDVYSFGMFVCRTMLSNQLPTTVGKFSRSLGPNECEELLEQMRNLKSSSKFLDIVIEALYASESIEPTYQKDLECIFQMTLQHAPDLRAPDFSPVVAILSPDEHR